MGGLAVDVSDIDDRLHSLPLTPAGLKLLAERGHSLEVSDGDIRDKSKADIFAKCLVILQVTWIALQTISRKATGYPLSPLEIHTVVHAACASVMYILWFHKPLDVQAPNIVSKAGFEDLIALMLMQTPRIGTTWYSHLNPLKDFKPYETCPRSEASFLLFDSSVLSWRDEGCSYCGRCSTPSTTTNIEGADKDVLPAIPKICDNCANLTNSKHQQERISEVRILSSQITTHPPAGIRCEPPSGVKAVRELRSGESTPEGICLGPLVTWRSYHDYYVPKKRYCGLWRFLDPGPPKPALPAQISPALEKLLPISGPDTGSGYRHEIKLSLSEKDLKRWKLASAAFLKEQGSNFGSRRYQSFKIRDGSLLAWRRRNVNGQLPDEGEYRLLLIVCLLASLYGGIHLALWNYGFPTSVESLLWRISAATLASVPILFVLLGLFDVTKDVVPYWRWKYWKIFRRLRSRVTDIWVFEGVKKVVISMSIVAVAAAMLFYSFACVFIVVESFISLRHVPIGVYEGGLGWSKYIPHL